MGVVSSYMTSKFPRCTRGTRAVGVVSSYMTSKFPRCTRGTRAVGVVCRRGLLLDLRQGVLRDQDVDVTGSRQFICWS